MPAMAEKPFGPYPNRLGDFMRARGMNDPQLAELEHTTKQQINKLRRGERQLTARWARRLATHLQADWKDLMDLPEPNKAEMPPKDGKVARLAALRRAWWAGDEAAAATLGVPLEKMRAQESGAEQLDNEYVLKILSVTRTSPSWIYDGSLEDVSPLVAARLAVVAPELIEGLERGPGDPPRRAAAAGETEPDGNSA